MPGRLLKRDIWTEQLSTPEQQKCSFLRCKLVQINVLGKRAKALRSCCQKYMPLALFRKKAIEIFQVLDVIQDEQPVWLIFEPTLDGPTT